MITLNVRAPTVVRDTTMMNQVAVSDPDEPLEPTDNNKGTASTLIVACFDVIGEDGKVTVGDVGGEVLHYGLASSQPQYDVLFDIDDKGAVTISDIGRVVSQFGRRCPV